MRETFHEYRPQLKWYHYLLVLYLGLPIGRDATGGLYVTLGGLVGAFVAVWLLVAGVRRLRTGSWRGRTMQEAGDA